MDISIYIDQKSLSDRLSGDFELFIELANIFIDDYKLLLESISYAFKKNDLTETGKAAHTLKGAVSNFSAVKIYNLAIQLEQECKRNKLEDAKSLFNDLYKCMDETVDAIKLIISNGSFF